MIPPLSHDQLVCGISDGTTCDACNRQWVAEARARWPALCRPGPQGWNQIASTVEQQFARVFQTRPD
jgi:hypothetical protein